MGSPVAIVENSYQHGVISDNGSESNGIDRRTENLNSLKAKLITVVEAIKTTHARIQMLEQDRSIASQNWSRAMDLQTMIKSKKEETEDMIEKNEKKLKNMKDRLLAKEQFVREAREFLQSEFVTLSTQEGTMLRKQQQINVYKQKISDKRAECLRMNAKKSLLEEKLERLDRKEDEIGKKKERLRSRLESYGAEELRSSRSCSDSSDAAYKSEQDCAEIEKDIQEMSKRTQAAMQRINALEGQVRRMESNLSATNFQRGRHEAMIREILISVQN